MNHRPIASRFEEVLQGYLRGELFRRDLILVLLTLAALGGVCEHDFVNLDDPKYIHNLSVESGLMPDSIVWAFETFEASNWHPLTWLSLEADAEFFGPSARTFHTVNLLFHIANVLSIAELLRRMTGRTWWSAAVAALFAVHPLHVESVAWVSERKDVLSTFFGLLTIAAYLRYCRAPGWKRMALAAGAFAASLLAKPMLVTLPCLLLLLDYWPLRRLRKGSTADASPFGQRGLMGLVAEKLPLFLLVAGSAVMTVRAQDSGGAVKSLTRLPMELRAQNALRSTVCYLEQTFWPTRMAAYYPYPTTISAAETATCAIVLAAITLIVCLRARSRPYLPVGWFWFLGTLIPVIGLVQVGSQGRADRYMYIPSIGLYIAMVWALFENRSRRGAIFLGSLLAAALAACVVQTRIQAEYWANSRALWEHTLAVTQDNYFALTKYGELLRRERETEAALAALQEAVRINPRMDPAYAEMAAAYQTLGRLDEAEECLRTALEVKPDSKRYRGALDTLRRTRNSK